MEGFYASLKKELVHRQRLKTRAQAKAAIFEYIEVFYSRQRRHSGVGYQTPQQAFNNIDLENGRIGSITKMSGFRDVVHWPNSTSGATQYSPTIPPHQVPEEPSGPRPFRRWIRL